MAQLPTTDNVTRLTEGRIELKKVCLEFLDSEKSYTFVRNMDMVCRNILDACSIIDYQMKRVGTFTDQFHIMLEEFQEKKPSCEIVNNMDEPDSLE